MSRKYRDDEIFTVDGSITNIVKPIDYEPIPYLIRVTLTFLCPKCGEVTHGHASQGKTGMTHCYSCDASYTLLPNNGAYVIVPTQQETEKTT